MKLHQTLAIEKMGQRGEGVAAGPIFVPYALPGDRIVAEVDGGEARLAHIIEPSPHRGPPICPAYADCGGCAVQGWDFTQYAAWKRALVVDALRHAGVASEVGALVDAHGAGRRRVVFHARTTRAPSGRLNVEVGFMRARSHDIIAVEACPILAPGLALALPAARALAQALAALEKPLDIALTATLDGLDVDIRGCGKLDFALTQRLIELAQAHDLARLSNHHDILVERRPPMLAMGAAQLTLPPGGFLQATQEGERRLAELAIAGVGEARRVADLFSGVGTFALRLAQRAETRAVEGEAAMLAACLRAGAHAPGLRGMTGETRDLFRRPLQADELASFDAVVLDPPRAGAQAQMAALADSKISRVVSVSCNAQTFARDAAILIAGGFRLDSVTPLDQFRHSPHVEIVGVLSRPSAVKRRRGLLSQGRK